MAFIEVQGVSKSFTGAGGVRHVLEDVNLTVERGEFISIVGFMGCGKSTFLNIVAGLLPAEKGRVAIGGEVVRGVRNEAAYVFQNYSLLPWLSAIGNVQLAVSTAFPSWTKEQQHAHSRKYLDLVGLGTAVHRRPGQLSGGMRQRVAICRALVHDPSILLMDEPFSALDAITRDDMNIVLLELWERYRKTVLFVTHSIREAVLLSDRVLIMGRSPSKIIADMKVPFARPRDFAIGESSEFNELCAMLRNQIEIARRGDTEARH